MNHFYLRNHKCSLLTIAIWKLEQHTVEQLSICLEQQCDALQSVCRRMSFSASEVLSAISLNLASLAFSVYPENEPVTHFYSVTGPFSLPPQPSHFRLSAHPTPISLLLFALSLSLSLYPFVSQELTISWVEVKVCRLLQDVCHPSSLRETERTELERW